MNLSLDTSVLGTMFSSSYHQTVLMSVTIVQYVQFHILFALLTGSVDYVDDLFCLFMHIVKSGMQ